MTTAAGSPPVKVQALTCPNCGGQVELRGFTNTLTAVCGNCASVLDASSPLVQIVHQFNKKQIRKPLIALGTRGKFDNSKYEVIGFQTRAIEVEGTPYEWGEYVLFNPYKGFLYLTEYQGHWNLVRPLRALPVQKWARSRPALEWRSRTFRHFQQATAKTVFVLGEFPWHVSVSETVRVDDYTSPPFVLSGERNGNEVTWSEGEYIQGSEVWAALGLKGSPPRPSGVYVNQPSPYKDTRSIVRLCLFLEVALFTLLAFFVIFTRQDTVFQDRYQFVHRPTAEASFVTPIFELKGRVSNVEVRTKTDLDNQWLYFNFALINNDTGQGYDFGREVSYYHGHDSDGDWSEGGRNDSVIVPSVPPGNYYLRVEPESDSTAGAVNYEILVKRDVPSYLLFVIAALLLPLPAIALVWRTFRFEHQRWQESDYAKGS